MENNVMGIVRHIDDLGRIVIPKEIRRAMGIKEGNQFGIFTTAEGMIILRKVEDGEPVYNCPRGADTEPEKITYTFKDDYYDDSYRVVTITREQEKLLNWLNDNGYLDNDVNFNVGYPDGDDLTK